MPLSSQDQVFGPKVSFTPNSFHGIPCASTVPPSTVFPHQLRETLGKTKVKKITIAETATPESSAADRT
jgi:hypothetical protein